MMLNKLPLFLGCLLLFISCNSPGNPESGVWKYDHERTKDKLRILFEGSKLSEEKLDAIVVHFKKHPPELELKNGRFEMKRLIKTTGSFSGACKFDGDSLELFPEGKDEGWKIHYDKLGYDKNKDEYTVVFILYPIVLSRIE